MKGSSRYGDMFTQVCLPKLTDNKETNKWLA